MKTVIAAALGECVHVAGISNFLRLAEQAGWRTVFLGPAVPISEVIAAVKREHADLVGVSYRLTAETGERLLGEFAEAADELHHAGVRFAFGGTPPVAQRAGKLGFFEAIFDGSETEADVLTYLKGEMGNGETDPIPPQSTIERIRWKAPYPILRHHFGLPTMDATLEGIEKIANSKTIDVISLGIDQDAQEISSTRNDRIPGEPVRGVFRSAHLMTTGRYIKPAGQGTIPFCGHILAPMISSSWRRCMWIPFTLHGAPFRYSGLTKWMDAVPGTLKDPSGSTRRS